MKGLAVLGALALSACSCATLEAPTEPAVPGASRFVPPAQYAAYWYEVENCLGARADLRDVRFYSVATGASPYFPCWHLQCLARYARLEHAIYLGEWWLSDPVVVRHEMIHALGVTGHPADVFAACAQDYDYSFRRAR